LVSYQTVIRMAHNAAMKTGPRTVRPQRAAAYPPIFTSDPITASDGRSALRPCPPMFTSDTITASESRCRITLVGPKHRLRRCFGLTEYIKKKKEQHAF
ncbi:MAG: hypothetical protein N2378_10340, partial [Chloroflexaceae bacterium]|nr:hypothetical protein [Chloroflexaceae bacterium]